MTGRPVERILKEELPRFGLKYEDNSDGGISRLSVVRVQESFIKMILGQRQDSTEVARLIGSPLNISLEVMVFDSDAFEEVESVLEQVKKETGKNYKIIKAY